MANRNIEDTPMGRIVIGIMQSIGWFFLCLVVFPTVLLYAAVSSTGAFLVLTLGFLVMFLDEMRILIRGLIFGQSAHKNVKCREFQEMMARYSRLWLDDTPPTTPVGTDDEGDNPPANHILPPTMACLFGTQVLPHRRRTAAVAPEPRAKPFRYSDSDEERNAAERRIDKETPALAMRSAMEERERIADGPRCLTLPERRRLRLDRQREASDRASLIYQLNHSRW